MALFWPSCDTKNTMIFQGLMFMPYEILGIKLFSVKEASENLGMSTKDVKRYLREGRLLGKKIDNSWVVPEPGLMAFMSVEKDRKKVRSEAIKLKNLFDQFLEKGDISKDYHAHAVKRLSDFL
jgi:hypothetical protein